MSEPGVAANYPGNPSLPVEVREKILSTFRHTLDLFRDGKVDDCLIGCDFILKMDPRFGPARKLQEKAKNPKSEIDVSELAAAVSSTPPASPPPRETGAVPAPRRETGGVPPPPRPSGSATLPRRDTAPVSPPPPKSFAFPGTEGAAGASEGSGLEGLDDLSLDSLSLDGSLPDLASHGGSREPGLPFEPGAGDAAFAGLSQGPLAADPELAAAQSVSLEQEIASLLEKGDDARRSGDLQQAIEIWSRIFLIDINNTDAVTRIEEARRAMAAESQRIAASLGKGQESFAKGDLAAARTQFDTVLSLGEDKPAAVSPPPLPRATAPAGPPLPPHDLSALAAPGDVLAEEMDQSGPPGGRRSWMSIPRPPRETLPVDASAAEPATKPSGLPFGLSPRIAIIAGASLAVIVAAAFFLLRSSGGGSESNRASSGPTLEHATQLFREGKIEETTAELRQIPLGHPDYERAQKLLASLADGKDAAPRPAAGGAAPAPLAPNAADPAALRAEAERALGDKRYIDAMKSFSLAAPHFQGDPTFSQEMAAASEKVSELTPAVKLYNDGEYETAIPILWRIYQVSRDNQDARSYLTRAYYNQGVIQLQNGLYEKAEQAFGEVLGLDPQDVDAARHRQFAARYRSGDLDLMGRIYVRYISPRP